MYDKYKGKVIDHGAICGIFLSEFGISTLDEL